MNIVGYIRLSRDEDKENYSSIEMQKKIISDYACSRNWSVTRIYIDDNYSGYTFTRPAFIEMIEEVEKENIDVIIAKDLSRIGRKNSKVLTIVDDFKDRNIRLILVDEGSKGGLDILEDDLDTIGITTWCNERYVKDTSKKIRSHMHKKQEIGELFMGNHFGYKKLKVNGKFNLIVDEDIKPIIELIFKEYINGSGYKRICDILDEEGYITPSEYIKKRREDNGKVFKNQVSSKWQTYMIQRIIQNDLYIGTFRTKKRESKYMKGKQLNVPKEMQYVFPNHHAAMIDEETFQLAQEINKKRNERSYRTNRANYNYIFASFMECGDCGYTVAGLNLRKTPNILRGYNCMMYHKYGISRCKNHSIEEEKVLFFFKELLKDIRKEYEEYIDAICCKDRKDNNIKLLEKYKRDITTANEELKLLINLKLKDIIKANNSEQVPIIEKAYVDLEVEKKNNILDLEKKANELQKICFDDTEKKIKSNIEIFDAIIDSDKPERKHLEMILDKILVYSDRTLEFRLKVDINKMAFSDTT